MLNYKVGSNFSKLQYIYSIAVKFKIEMDHVT